MNVTAKVISAIGMIVIIIALLSMISTIVEEEETAGSDASNWNFTGATGADSLLGLVPFVWIAAILLVVVGGSFAVAEIKGGFST